MNKPRILIIDDQLTTDESLKEEFCQKCALLEIGLTTTDLEINSQPEEIIGGAYFCSGQVLSGSETVNSIEDVLRIVEAGWIQNKNWKWSLILLDVRFDSNPIQRDDETFGLKILETLVKKWADSETGEGNCEIPVVMLSIVSRDGRGRQASRAGAREYVEKSDLNKKLLNQLLDKHGLIEDSFGLLVGNSLPLLKTLRLAREVAYDGKGNLLILGETGSGKTVLAEYIHRHTQHSNLDYHSFTVSAGREPSVLKSDLYGYWHGAFTSAEKSESGKAERAHNSTLFLDEIGNLPASGQAELLEYARLNKDGSRSFDRLGTFPSSPERLVTQAQKSLIGEYNPATQKISVNVFLITATNELIDDPDHRKKIGFRDDLFSRLGAESHKYISFPSLRTRPDDLLNLFYFYLEKRSIENGGVWSKQIDPKVIEYLRSYEWKGNVAELKGIVSYVEKNSRNWDEVLPRHLPQEITKNEKQFEQISVSGIKNKDNNKSQDNSFSNTIDFSNFIKIMANVQMPSSRSGLKGSLEIIQKSYKELIENLLELALNETLKLNGDLAPTSAVNLLLGKTITTPQAASLLLRLAKFFSLNPPDNSNLFQALEWSKKRRHGK